MTWPGEGVSALPAEDYARIIETYADRVHDIVRRMGVSADAATEIVLTSAADLADAAAAGDPSTVAPAGWGGPPGPTRQPLRRGRGGGARRGPGPPACCRAADHRAARRRPRRHTPAAQGPGCGAAADARRAAARAGGPGRRPPARVAAHRRR